MPHSHITTYLPGSTLSERLARIEKRLKQAAPPEAAVQEEAAHKIAMSPLLREYKNRYGESEQCTDPPSHPPARPRKAS